MFTATTITCLRQRGSAPHPGATAPTVRASPGSSCWRCSRRAARAAPSLHLRACCATRAGAPRPPRDRCGPSRAPRARPSPAQPHCPALRPSQPSRQPACLSTRPRRALALARVGVLEWAMGTARRPSLLLEGVLAAACHWACPRDRFDYEQDHGRDPCQLEVESQQGSCPQHTSGGARREVWHRDCWASARRGMGAGSCVCSRDGPRTSNQEELEVPSSSAAWPAQPRQALDLRKSAPARKGGQAIVGQ